MQSCIDLDLDLDFLYVIKYTHTVHTFNEMSLLLAHSGVGI